MLFKFWSIKLFPLKIPLEQYIKLPFEGKGDDNNELLYERIKNDPYNKEFLEDIECSDDIKDFIDKTLEKDAKKRMTVDEALNHPWIKKYRITSLDPSLINEDSIISLSKTNNNEPPIDPLPNPKSLKNAKGEDDFLSSLQNNHNKEELPTKAKNKFKNRKSNLGKSKGVIIKNNDRSYIRQIRFEDYIRMKKK